MLRTFIKKSIRVLTVSDIARIREEVDRLSPYPWTPKAVTELSKPYDIEFAAKAPEVILQLCKWVLALYSKLEAITFSYNIPTCSRCKHWKPDVDLIVGDITYGGCNEPTNVDFFARIESTVWITPMNYGCINGEKKASLQEN